jgi:hypothetical protein
MSSLFPIESSMETVPPVFIVPAKTDSLKKWKELLKSGLREPFFHFVILGALLFAFNEYLEARANHSRIEISKEQVEAISRNYKLQYGSTPSAEQLKVLVDSFIKEEVFYHEALKLNLDKDDEIIRRRLVQKYEFLQQDLGIPKEPTGGDLLTFYQQHKSKYQIPEKVTFSHVFFSTDSRGDGGARVVAQKTLDQLNRLGVSRAPDSGDNFPGLYDYSNMAGTEISRLFGNGELATEVFNEPLNKWSGPFRSGYGWHIVYVSSKQAATTPPFEEIRDAVQRDYVEYYRGLRNVEILEKLKKSFTIVIGAEK